MEFNENLYHLRKARGYTQDQLADLCHVSRQAISKWENGTANPDLNNLRLLSKVLNVSMDTLVGNERNEIQEQISYRFAKEYTSKLTVFGVPLLHINIGRGKRRVAKGIFAIGNIAVGVVSIGFMSAGILSFGILTLGLGCAIGCLALSYFAVGALAIGYIAIGAMAIGVYSIGALSIGYQVSIGALSYGTTALGPASSTFGDVTFPIQNGQDCIVGGANFDGLQHFLQSEHLPVIMRVVLEHFTLC